MTSSVPAPGCKCSLAIPKPIDASNSRSCSGPVRCISLKNSARCGWHAPRMANLSPSSRTILASIQTSNSTFDLSKQTKSRRPISIDYQRSRWMESFLILLETRSSTTSCVITQATAFTRRAATMNASQQMPCCIGSEPIAPVKRAAFRTSCRHCRSLHNFVALRLPSLQLLKPLLTLQGSSTPMRRPTVRPMRPNHSNRSNWKSER